ncbi:MAG: response regulator [Ferruginibacter sp.]
MAYRNILLIDDDVEDQEIFREALQVLSDSLICTAFSNAKEALNKLTVDALNPDVIFLDLNMPIMSGQEFLTYVKKLDTKKDIPVIIFSTSSNPSTIQVTKDLGAIDFITKPDRFDRLVEILKPIIN